MEIADILAPEAVIPSLKAHSKKHVIQEVAARAAKLSGLPEREIFDTLLQRERLGSTGIGNGIAIPHGKLVSLGTLFGTFARLEQPVDFEALDGRKVDLVFALFAPEGAGADHLKALAKIARVLRADDVAAHVRDADGRDEIRRILVEHVPTDA